MVLNFFAEKKLHYSILGPIHAPFPIKVIQIIFFIVENMLPRKIKQTHTLLI